MIYFISNRFLKYGEFNLEVQHTSKVKDIHSFPLFLRRLETGKLLGITLIPPVNGLEWRGLISSHHDTQQIPVGRSLG